MKPLEKSDPYITRINQCFDELHRAIDRLGAPWGIRNEFVFRPETIALLEERFGSPMQSRLIEGEQFDVIISGDQHILVEIVTGPGRNIQEQLERKRQLYTEATGVMPARVVLAVDSIHSRRAQQLRDAGFEVIEPED